MNLLRRDNDKPGAPATGCLGALTQPRSPSLALRACLLLFLCLAREKPIWAAAPPHIDDKGIRIGLRDGPEVARSRNGVWAPVQVPIKAGPDDISRDSYRLIVETTDGEAVPYRYTAAVPAIPANSEQAVFAYIRPGSPGAIFTVTLQKADGSDVQTVEHLTRDPSKREILEPREVLYLTLGSRLHGLKIAPRPDAPPDRPGKPAQQGENPAEDVPVPGFASIENVADMPDRWFGYEAVDVMVITTSSDAFVEQLQAMSQARRDALLEWVRRGGKLVLSVGRNQQGVSDWLKKVPLVDGVLKSKITRASLPNLQTWCGADPRQKQPLRQVEIVCVQPGPNMNGLVYEDPVAGDLEIRPILLQSSCGLGRVLLVAFDLDAPPFSTWDGQGAFWKKLQEEISPRVSAGDDNLAAGAFVQGGELGVDLKRELETFAEVPVISFGWVALFILFYIVLVGPLDYFILKKVFKRLELTWITFPALVLIVSVAAYATAYYFKGDDLRINKIDLVEFDLHGPGQVYGQSWFTLFSPRIQNYTLGLEPVAPEWGGRWGENDADAPVPPMMVAVMDGPDPGLGGSTQSLFRRPYEYAADAGGLRRVPIPVWATRTFTSSWRVPLRDRQTKDRPPPIQAELRLSRDGRALSGAITNNLPAELQGAALFFQGQWYKMGDLVPGESRDVAPLFERDVKPHPLAEWFTIPNVLMPRPSSIPSGQQQPTPSLASYGTLRSLLFYSAPGGGQQPNSGLRQLDEGWRVLSQGEGQQRRYRDEAILVARMPPRSDRAESVAQDGVSPTRLWFDDLPGTQTQRPALSGYLQQETYVRIYIPLIRSR
ncbi:MAG TPA: hypothetical protein VMG10_13785 [Gemmataceae bacterium]|nr:hypothetical protein [Gemmataceae bacterium]